MGNSISKEMFELEQYKLILEIDEMAQEIQALKIKLREKEEIILKLQKFYLIPNHEIYEKDEFYNLFD